MSNNKEPKDGLDLDYFEVRRRSVIQAFRTWAGMIKIEHSLFALPFAWLGCFLALRALPPLIPVVWLTIGMVGIRCFAMTLNRIADRDIDAINPRTANRSLVTGEMSVRMAKLFMIISLLVFFLACASINKLTIKLSPVPVIAIIVYSYSKRFTWLTHFLLGSILAMSVLAGWITVDQNITISGLLFACAVIFWVAGFDMIYSCQDMEFDRANNLKSAPAKVGVEAALIFASFSHGIFAVFLFIGVWSANLGWVGWLTWSLVAGLLLWQHSLVKPDDLKRVNTAFFTLNAMIAAIVLIGLVSALFVSAKPLP